MSSDSNKPLGDIRPFYHEGHVSISGGKTLHLVLDFRSIDVIEHLTKQSMDVILPELASPPHNLAAKLLWSMLREYHDDISLNDVMGIVVDKKYGPIVGDKVSELLILAYDIGKAKGKNPRKPRGASKSS